MYRIFLNDDDYLGVITKETLSQLTRGNAELFVQAEKSAEMSIVEYLSENYEIEQELNKGKYIAEYDRSITYPVGVHIYMDGRIHEVIHSISGYKAPAYVEYWEEYVKTGVSAEEKPHYSQFATYYKDDVLSYNGTLYICLVENGFKFGNIRIPMVTGWLEADMQEWQPTTYDIWDVVRYEDGYYALLNLDDFDNNINPLESDNWSAIADYDPSYNEYELSVHEYVVCNEKYIILKQM